MKKTLLRSAALLLALVLAGCSAGDILDEISPVVDDPPGTDWRTYRGYSYGTIHREEGPNLLYFLYDDNALDFYLDDSSRTSIFTLDLSECDDASYIAENLFFADKNDDGYNDLCLPLVADQLVIWPWDPDRRGFADRPLSPDGPWLTFAPWPEELVYRDSAEGEQGTAQYTWSLPGDVLVAMERSQTLDGGMDAILQRVAEEQQLDPAAITIREDEQLSQKLGCAAYGLAYETQGETGGLLHEERYIQSDGWDFRVHLAAPPETGGVGELLQCLVFQLTIPSLYNYNAEPTEPGAGTDPVTESGPDPEGLFGEYTVLRGGYHDAMRSLGDDAQGYLSQTMQIGDSLYLLWRVGGQDFTQVERIDATSGEAQHQASLDGLAFHMRPDVEDPQQIRVYFSNRIEFLSAEDLSIQATFAPPEALDLDMWRYNELTCAPFDALLTAGQIAYTAEEGIFLADLDGENARLVLANQLLPEVLAGAELPEHDPSQLHYVGPLLMNGGARLVASTYLVGDSTGDMGGYDSRPFGISAVEIDSGALTHHPDVISWLSFPASWLDDDRVGFLGNEGYLFYTPSSDAMAAVDLDPHQEMLFDGSVLVHLDEDGKGIYSYPAGQPEEQTILLEAPDAQLALLGVTEAYVVLSCMTGDELDAASLILVPYRS